MIALKQFAAAVAACNLFSTTLALPTASSDTTPLTILGDTANTPPPTACSIQERDSTDVYGITLPINYSDITCTKAQEALADITNTDKDWVYEPYGTWTIIFFSANKGAANQVNDAMSEVFPKFSFSCANSKVADVNSLVAREPPSALVKRDAVPAHEQSCVAENKGLFNFYWVRVGEAFDVGRCEEFGRLLDDASPALWRYTCGPDGFGGVLAHFEETINRAGYINEVAHRIWLEVNGFNCLDH